MERREVTRAVAAAIAALPERQRAPSRLTYHEGFSNAETADEPSGTSVSAGNPAVRAKRTLRQNGWTDARHRKSDEQ